MTSRRSRSPQQIRGTNGIGSSRSRGAEEGAVAVVAAITLSVLVLMAAFVVDLGLVRVDTGRSQSTADMAAAAGANELDVITDWNAREACAAALAYAESNLGANNGAAAPVNVDASCLRRWLTMPTCNPADPRTAEYTLGRYRVEITIPVPDGHPLMGAQALETDYDGEPCERVGVQVQAERDFILAGVGGFTDTASIRSAVGRAYAAGSEEALASLIVLRPNQFTSSNCTALSVSSNNTTVQIGSVTTVVDGQPVFYPGVISAYSVPATGVCTGNNQQVMTIESQGGGAFIRADGLILSYGLDQGSSANQIYQAGAVANGTLAPQPRPGPPTKRSTIDHLYNCKTSYPSGPSWSPASYSLPYDDDCEEGTRAYIEALHGAYQNLTGGDAASADWVVFPDDSASWACNDAQFAGTLPADVPTTRDPSRWFINCPGNTGPTTFQPNGFTLVDVDRVVFNGEIRMTSGSSNLRIDGGSNGATVYVQAGDIERNSGDLRLQNMSLFVDDGRINLAGNAGTVELRALPLPSGTTACAGWVVGSGAPPPDCFERLAAWANIDGFGQQDGHVLGGGSSLFVQGIFFSPNSWMRVNGSGDTSTLNCDPNTPVPATAKVNLRDAQLWSSKIEMGGSGSITLCPSPTFAEPIEIPGSSLIRGTG